MNDNKSRDIFYGVIAVATLIVALIGATLAYFSMNASSNEGAVNATAAIVSVDYEDGQQVIAQGKNLIPSSFDVVKTIYENNLDAINQQANTEYQEGETERTNLCQDGANPNYEVCSIYRFSVKNDVETSIRAALRTEANSFTDLYYAVRVVSGNDTNPKTGEWLDLDFDDNGESLKYVKLSTCDNSGETACFTENEGIKTYANIAAKPIFGFTSASDSSFKTINIAANKYTFDVVLFILEKDKPQDYDQGKTYSGTIFVETTNNTGNITGRVS